jgi:cytidylate kinase
MTASPPAASPPPLVVTLFESYGAGADAIAPRIAAALGVPYHAQAFSSEEIEEAESGQETGGVLGRVLTAVGGGAPFALGAAVNPGPELPVSQQELRDLALENTRTVHELARGGGVILGRNGAYVLAGRPATLHVRLDAPVQHRIRRAADEGGIDVARAQRRQKREDELRAEMSLTFYRWDPRDLDRYDLVVNTAAMDDETCVAVIVSAARAKAEAERRTGSASAADGGGAGSGGG